ncbi:MAG: hypothetical protein J6B56_06015 [Clostridia bacterium]|nr:hypothetical protein [Clostridia bacterium]
MKIYFLSSRPCALTLNDAYFGLTDHFERFAELSLKDNVFVRFTPENAQPIGFFLNEAVRHSPPAGCEVYLLSNAIAIYARDFPPSDLSLKILCQKHLEKSTLTLFYQGALQLSIETEEGFFVSTLPPSFERSELFYESGLFFLKAPDALAIYTKTGERVLLENYISMDIKSGELHARLPLSDSLGRIADCVWTLDENGVTQIKCALSQARTISGEHDPARLQAELLPFAFFESVLVGADYASLLSNDLAPQAERLKEYLGDFKAVTLTDDPNVCGLVYAKGERLFEVKPFTVTLQNGKIADVQG